MQQSFLGETNPFGIIKSGKINSGHGNMRQQLHNSQEFYQIVIRARKIGFFPQETRRRRNGENSTDTKEKKKKKENRLLEGQIPKSVQQNSVFMSACITFIVGN